MTKITKRNRKIIIIVAAIIMMIIWFISIQNEPKNVTVVEKIYNGEGIIFIVEDEFNQRYKCTFDNTGAWDDPCVKLKIGDQIKITIGAKAPYDEWIPCN